MLTGSAVQSPVQVPITTVNAAHHSQPTLYAQQAQYAPRPVTVVRPVTTKPVTKTVYLRDNRTYFQKHPMVKGATIGAGLGAGIGAATGLITGRGILRGGVIGAGTGAGVGVIRTSQMMKRHPIARDVATGAVSGLGLGWAASRCPSTKWKTAGVGGLLGLGVGLWKHLQ